MRNRLQTISFGKERPVSLARKKLLVEKPSFGSTIR